MYVYEDQTSDLEDWIQEEIGLKDRLKVDDEGLSARRVQECLNLRGSDLAIDADYRPVTKRVVTNLQEDLFLNATGKMDEGTFSFLIQPIIEPLKLRLTISESVNNAILADAQAHLARHLLEIGGQKYGPWVRLVMKWNQGDKYPWCAGFMTFILHQATESLNTEMSIPRTLFENMPICILVVDRTVAPEIILNVNRRAELVYGYTAKELVGHPVASLVPEESITSIHNILQCARWGETLTTEITNRHRDNTAFPVRVIATPDPANNDRIFMAVEDITAERQRRNESEAIDRERLRIAHEIHDGIAQDLAGLRLKSVLWHQLADTDPTRMHAALDELQNKLNADINGLRRTIFALRPVDLDALGFFPSLTKLIREFGESNHLATQLVISVLIENLPAAYELPLYRIIQEGLNNIRQHANASSVYVQFKVYASGSIMVSVRDNGRGFHPNLVGRTEFSGHFGLRQMRERILDLGGTLDIHSAKGRGTELCITLPPIAKEV